MKPMLPLLFLLAVPTVVNSMVPVAYPAAPPDPPAPALPAKSAQSPERFQDKIRDDFFAGFAGNKEALERAMLACEAALKKQPDYPEALVWHGCGLIFRAGVAFQKGDRAGGITLWQNGISEMDRAVKLAPDDITVRIPRATCLITASRNAPGPQQRPLLERAREDLELVYRKQQPALLRLSRHSRGELLMGLAEVYKRLGEEEKAKVALDEVTRACASTPYADEAIRWLKPTNAASSAPRYEHTCIGCHG